MNSPGMLAVPCREWSWTRSLFAIVNLAQSLPSGSMFSNTVGSTSVAGARNYLARNFLAQPHLQWLLLVDSDQTPTPDTGARLLARGDLDIVGGLYVLRDHNYPAAMTPLESHTGPFPAAGLHEVRHVGGGCMLIRRRVLEAMPEGEWFTGAEASDLSFCDRARALGFRVWLDADLWVGHLGVVPLTPANTGALRGPRP